MHLTKKVSLICEPVGKGKRKGKGKGRKGKRKGKGKGKEKGKKRKKREKLGLIHWSYGNVNMGLLLCLGQQVSTARCSVWAVLCRAGMAPKGWARGRLLPDS